MEKKRLYTVVIILLIALVLGFLIYTRALKSDVKSNTKGSDIQKVLVCGKVEHTHSASCYAVHQMVDGKCSLCGATDPAARCILICTLEEHKHSDTCY